jgi:hypothetical protein
LVELCGLVEDGTVAHKLQLLTSGDDMFYENILGAQREAADSSGTMQMIRHLSMDTSINGKILHFINYDKMFVKEAHQMRLDLHR